MMVVIYLKGGSVIVCRGYSKCPVTGMLKLDHPHGITDSILPNTSAKHLLIWQNCVDRIYVGEKINSNS